MSITNHIGIYFVCVFAVLLAVTIGLGFLARAKKWKPKPIKQVWAVLVIGLAVFVAGLICSFFGRDIHILYWWLLGLLGVVILFPLIFVSTTLFVRLVNYLFARFVLSSMPSVMKAPPDRCFYFVAPVPVLMWFMVNTFENGYPIGMGPSLPTIFFVVMPMSLILTVIGLVIAIRKRRQSQSAAFIAAAMFVSGLPLWYLICGVFIVLMTPSSR